MSVPQIPVYVINLDSRPDRWEIIRKICLTAGIHPIRISAVKASPGWHGCALSHKKVAEVAKAAGYPWYLVLEDDATFSHNDWRYFMTLAPYLWTHRDKWDIFTGGTGIPSYIQLIEKDPVLYHIKGPCTHFLLVSEKAYDAVCSWTTNSHHFDHYLKERTKMVGTYPFIAMQAVSQSDIGIGDPNYELENGHKFVKSYVESQ